MQFLDAETRRELDFDAVWQRIRPVSPLGQAAKRQAEAFLPHQAAQLEESLLRLEQAADCLRRQPQGADALAYFLSNLRDISALVDRAGQGEVLDDTELYEVKKLLLLAADIQGELERLQWSFLLPEPLDPCTGLKAELSRGQGSKTSFYIADAYDQELAALRRARLSLEERLTQLRSGVEEKVRRFAGRGLSMDDEISVSPSDTQLVGALSAVEGLVKVQTSPEAITFRLLEGEELAELRRELGELREREEALKARVRQRLSRLVGAYAPQLLRILKMLGFLDFLLAKARFCLEIRGVRPKLCAAPRLAIQQGRHLLVEEEVQGDGGVYCPLSLELGPGVTLLTGPNMGGKTVSLQTIGLLTAMAQYGLLVPAQAMEFQPRRFIRVHLASSQRGQGLSKFAGEMAFVREVIAHSQDPGLILLDELAHGTNPAEGAAVAQAVVERLRGEPAMTVITTHFPSLVSLEGVCHYRVRGLRRNLLQEQGQLLAAQGSAALRRLMDYSLERAAPGQFGQSDAVLVAEAMGLEPEIIARAKALQRSDSHG